MKRIIPLVLVGVVVFIGTSFIKSRQIDNIKDKLREEREAYEKVIVQKDEQLGEYFTLVGTLQDNLSKEQTLTNAQKEMIKILEKSLKGKMQEISFLKLKIKDLTGSGIADSIVVVGDTITYTVEDIKQGAKLRFTLDHPSGRYNYNIVYDPLSMEIYMVREKGTGIKVGSIRFPEQPWITVGSWNLVYDTDTRPWYQRFYDNLNLYTGAVVGEDLGMLASVGYNRVNIGVVITEESSGYLLMYKLK